MAVDDVAAIAHHSLQHLAAKAAWPHQKARGAVFHPWQGNPLPKAKNAPRGLLGPSEGIHMHPPLFILGFIVFILAVFGLMELHARSTIRKFEQTIKHSQE